jgi:hypothetical protein
VRVSSFLYLIMLSRDGVTTDEVWIGTWIYWTVTDPWLQVFITVPLIHTLYSSLDHTRKSSEPALSSPLVRQVLPAVDVPLPLGARTAPCLNYQLLTATVINLPFCLCVKHPFWARDYIYVIAFQLRLCWCETPSLTRGWFSVLQLLLVLTSTVSSPTVLITMIYCLRFDTPATWDARTLYLYPTGPW